MWWTASEPCGFFALASGSLLLLLRGLSRLAAAAVYCLPVLCGSVSCCMLPSVQCAACGVYNMQPAGPAALNGSCCGCVPPRCGCCAVGSQGSVAGLGAAGAFGASVQRSGDSFGCLLQRGQREWSER